MSTIDVLSQFVAAGISGVHTCMPGEVVRVLAGPEQRQFVDVLPALQRLVYDEESEQTVSESLPVIPCVPVAYMQGGGFYISVPLQPGDFVTLVFAERSLDHWLQVARKGRGQAVPAGDVGTHTLEGAIALPCGPAPRPELLAGCDAADLVIGGPTGILLRAKRDGSVHLAEGAGLDDVALAAMVKAELEDVKADLATLKTAIAGGFTAVGVASAASGTLGKEAFETALGNAWPHSPSSVAAGHVKAR
jgi:hypothetical protein